MKTEDNRSENRNSIGNPNEAQKRGCVSFQCKVEVKNGKCGLKFPNRKLIRRHLIEVHGKNGDDAPLRKYYEAI